MACEEVRVHEAEFDSQDVQLQVSAEEDDYLNNPSPTLFAFSFSSFHLSSDHDIT